MVTISALLALCAGNSPVTGEFPSQRPVTRSFDVFFDLRLNKRLSKQWRRRWFEIASRSLWRHCNVSVPAGFLILTLTTMGPVKYGLYFCRRGFQMHFVECRWLNLIQFHWDVFLRINLKITLNWLTNCMAPAEDKPSSEPMRTNVSDAIHRHNELLQKQFDAQSYFH